MSLGEIIQETRRKDEKVFDNAGQEWNHTFFWQCLRPKGGGSPGRAQAPDRQGFGDLAAFHEKVGKKAAKEFGSGWAWLALGDDKLEIVTTGTPSCRCSRASRRS